MHITNAILQKQEKHFKSENSSQTATKSAEFCAFNKQLKKLPVLYLDWESKKEKTGIGFVFISRLIIYI